MMSISENHTYFGFIQLVDKNGKLLLTKAPTQCSEIVRKYPACVEGVTKVIFYFPDDWLDNQFKNEGFIQYWTNLISNMVYPVQYLGKNPLNAYPSLAGLIDLATINRSLGYNTGQLEMHPERNTGDFIRNDLWHKFELDVDNNVNHANYLIYISYVFVRYIFSSYMRTIVKIFLRIKEIVRMNNQLISPLNRRELDDFKLIQLAHHYPPYFEGAHSEIYTVMVKLGMDDMCPKTVSIDDIKRYLKHGLDTKMLTTVNGAFSCRGYSRKTKREIAKGLSINKINETYDELL